VGPVNGLLVGQVTCQKIVCNAFVLLVEQAGIVDSLSETVKDFLAAGADKRQEIYDKAVEAVSTLTSTQAT
jgi:hypothetical protein